MLGKRCFPIARKPLKATVILFMFIFCWGFAFGTPAQAAEVVTDTTAYPPGDTALIDGYTFGADEMVTLQVTYLDGTPLDGPAGDPWDISTDALGDFETLWEVAYLSTTESLLVSATGQESGLTATTTTVVFAIGTNLDQLHNGTATKDPEWANGNINAQNSCYAEGDAVPFRYFVTKASVDTHFFTIQMEWTKAGIHAYDYPG